MYSFPIFCMYPPPLASPTPSPSPAVVLLLQIIMTPSVIHHTTQRRSRLNLFMAAAVLTPA